MSWRQDSQLKKTRPESVGLRTKTADSISILNTPIRPVILACTMALKRQFKRDDLNFQKHSDIAGNRVKYALVSSETGFGYTDSQYPVHSLFSESQDLHVGIILTFKNVGTRDRYDLEHVSILLFRGIPAQPLTPFLRAEWDLLITGPQVAPHAQPHWHVYGRRSAAHFEAEIAIQEFGYKLHDESEYATGHFHYAMSASWQDGGIGRHYVELRSVEALTRWTAGCLDYIKRQFTT